MAATLRELRDPLGWAVAVLALLANVILRAGWMKAAIVVLWPRPRPSALPAPAVDQPRRRGPAIPGSKLTSREMEVAALIPEGLTNRQIGYRLRPQVQETGVDHHVLNIMNKLGVHSRAEIAAWYTRQEATDKT